MQMTQPVKETIDKYDWMLDLYGRKRFTEEKKQYGEEEHEKGRQEGHEKGRQKGHEEEKERIALKMLKLKLHLDVINKATGMSMADILQLAKDNKLFDS